MFDFIVHLHDSEQVLTSENDEPCNNLVLNLVNIKFRITLSILDRLILVLCYKRTNYSYD